jgi:hypothetical protein
MPVPPPIGNAARATAIWVFVVPVDHLDDVMRLAGDEDDAAPVLRAHVRRQRRARRMPLRTLTSKNRIQSASGISWNGFGRRCRDC